MDNHSMTLESQFYLKTYCTAKGGKPVPQHAFDPKTVCQPGNRCGKLRCLFSRNGGKLQLSICPAERGQPKDPRLLFCPWRLGAQFCPIGH